MKSLKAALALVVLGGIGSVWLLSQPWVSATLFQDQMPAMEVSRTGATLYPASFAAAWLTVACAIVVVAAGPAIRRIVGYIVTACGIVVLVAPLAFFATDTAAQLSNTYQDYQSIAVATKSLFWFVLLFGVLTILAGVELILFSREWGVLSAEQANSATPKARSDWELLDDGHDPTGDQSSPSPS